MNIVKTLLALLILAQAGCSHVLVKPNGTIANQDHASFLIWKETFGRTDKAPAIRWITDFDCDSDISGRPGFMVWTPEGRVCREGYTVVPYQVEVAIRDGDKFSETTLAHEYAHAMQMLQGVFDPWHRVDSVWGVGGLVERANHKLRAEGY